MKPARFISGIILLICLVILSCKEEPLADDPVDPAELAIDEFTIVPASPTSKDVVKMVTYDCKYNQLASVTIKAKNIEVKKRFNSQMKWPCLLVYDTIQLGQLSTGNYKVTFLIVDTNPMVKDSVAVQQELTLKVKNK